MLMPDVNVLVGAFRKDAQQHAALRRWLRDAVGSGEMVGLTPAVASGTVRILTSPRIFNTPDSVEIALRHLERLRANASVLDVLPGNRNWEIFADLCREGDARGNLVADAAHAATAIEHGAIWVSLDRDFARFPGLKWKIPELAT